MDGREPGSRDGLRAASSSGTLYASRVTRVLDADGVLVLEYAVTTISAHPAEVLEDCKLLFQ